MNFIICPADSNVWKLYLGENFENLNFLQKSATHPKATEVFESYVTQWHPFNDLTRVKNVMSNFKLRFKIIFNESDFLDFYEKNSFTTSTTGRKTSWSNLWARADATAGGPSWPWPGLFRAETDTRRHLELNQQDQQLGQTKGSWVYWSSWPSTDWCGAKWSSKLPFNNSIKRITLRHSRLIMGLSIKPPHHQ